jgi:hypothetical protein
MAIRLIKNTYASMLGQARLYQGLSTMINTIAHYNIKDANCLRNICIVVRYGLKHQNKLICLLGEL